MRKLIGASLSGTDVVGRVQSSFLRAPGLYQLAAEQPAWATFSINQRRSGNVYAIDGRELFILHNYLRPDELEFDSVDRDWAIRTILGVGKDFKYEILSKEDWIGRRLVANKLRDRRAFICGDASHLWVPMAGYGMNAGIADATNLAWLLAGRVQGWAGETALDAYEAERLPITEQVSQFAMGHAFALEKKRQSVPDNLEDPSPQGQEVRKSFGQALYDLNVKQYCCAGLNFGYFYGASPIIAYDDAQPPAYTMDQFEPSTVPGCRAAHAWLEGNKSLFDVTGQGFALLRSERATSADALLDAAARKGVPLRLIDVDPADLPSAYKHKLVLTRPDNHVAWRGDSLPADPGALLDLVRGA